MVKAVIATLHFYNNFGSVLQAYALRRTLQKLGAEKADILPYRPALPEYQYFQEARLQQQYQEKCRKFQEFRRRHLGMEQETDASLDDEEKLSRSLGKYDVCIVGSDIVWGKEFSGLDPVYFLKCASPDSSRISYAASVILDQLGYTEADALFAEYLPDFDAVSVREISAVQSIQRFTKKKVSAVLDPTLLLEAEDYDGLVLENDEMKSAPYLLAYFLTHDPAVVDYTNMMARKLGLRVIHYFADYPGRVFPQNAGCFAFAGPEEFLGYVKNAACVFTNSFHGTCFSMIYRKPFYTYTAKRAMLSRVKDMVSGLGMENRFFTDFRDMTEVTGQIDYTKFGRKLEKARNESVSFLRNALYSNII